MAAVSLLRAGDPLAQASHQLRVLRAVGRQKPFEASLAESSLYPLMAMGIEVLQINLGRLCNMGCRHCHVDAGPDRREVMALPTMEACLNVLRQVAIPAVDLTGGAPEMNPHFRWLVGEARRLGRHVIDRSNLTVLLAPSYEDLPEFLAQHGIEIVASLPCYLAENVDSQRGQGAFTKSIEALRRLNALGYGRPQSGLLLTLVYNPLGPALPPAQGKLEADYLRELKTRYGVVFNRLHTITNLPIGRFLASLVQNGQYERYMETLIAAYNPQAAAGVMCRTTLSVDWTGRLHDCDFNQMLELGMESGLPQTIHEFDAELLVHRPIKTGQHCYGCAAGAGSGCRGAITAS
ncbi:MAG: arsenosugar biosynthesis radical SAM (seleno)protein ArsS [Pirellulales bacterium]